LRSMPLTFLVMNGLSLTTPVTRIWLMNYIDANIATQART
jgi:hypothetical protein